MASSTERIRCGAEGQAGPADHLGGQRRVGLDQIGDVVGAEVGVLAQFEDLLRGLLQRRDLHPALQALADAPGGEALHGLHGVVRRTLEIEAQAPERDAEACGTGLVQQAAVGLGVDFQQHVRPTGVEQQGLSVQQALVVQAGHPGQRRQAGEGAQPLGADQLLQSGRTGRGQGAAGDRLQAVEIQQLVVGEQHSKVPTASSSSAACTRG